MTAIVDSKACRRCGETKLFSEFSKNKLGAFGLKSVCKECLSTQGKAVRAANKKPRPPRPILTEKTCSRCEVVKPLSAFHKAATKSGGVAACCRDCVAAIHKAHTARYLASNTQAPSEKVCPRCATLKSASAFMPNRARKDKLSVYCIECQRAYAAEKQYDKIRYSEFREEELERGRKYRAVNLEKVREASRLSRKAHRHKHLGLIRVKNVERKLRIKGATPSWADRKAMAAIYEEARRLEREDGRKRHVDHVVPLHGRSVCGLHVETNMRIVFARENLIKTNKFEVQ